MPLYEKLRSINMSEKKKIPPPPPPLFFYLFFFFFFLPLFFFFYLFFFYLFFPFFSPFFFKASRQLLTVSFQAVLKSLYLSKESSYWKEAMSALKKHQSNIGYQKSSNALVIPPKGILGDTGKVENKGKKGVFNNLT